MPRVKAEPIQPPAPVIRMRLPCSEAAACARSRASGGRSRKLSHAQGAGVGAEEVSSLMLFMPAVLPLCVRPGTSGAEATTAYRAASLYTAGGRGAGFRDFLRLPSAKENRSNRRTLPAKFMIFQPRIHLDVDPSNCGGVGKTEAGKSRPFPYRLSAIRMDILF